MHSLIFSQNGEDEVTVSANLNRLEELALQTISDLISSWDDFDQLEEAILMRSILETKDADSAMELFTDITDKYDKCVFMRIVPTQILYDA